MSILLILVALALVLMIVAAVQRSLSKGRQPEAGGRGDGADIIAYLVLALAMGVAGFALANLASIAFPGDRFVFDPGEEVATALAALVVSTPFVFFFWRRQARRRVSFPRSAGWTLYLCLIEAVFLTAFVVSASRFVSGLLGGDSTSSWTGALVFGAIVVFHEYAVRATPPRSDAAELRRVIGSAISLGAAAAGLAGTLNGVLELGYETLGATTRDLGFDPWLGMLIVATPIWWYRWLTPWESEPDTPRISWTIAVCVIALAVALGAATSILVMVLQFMVAETPPAGSHFETLPVGLALTATGLIVWQAHRRGLGSAKEVSRHVYQYAMASIALITAVVMLVLLTVAAFDADMIVGGGIADVVAFATTLLAALAVWLWFDRRAGRVGGEGRALSWPRRIYTLGLGGAFALVAAGALITTLFILLRRLLVDDAQGSILVPASILAYTGLAAWYLLAGYFRERGTLPPVDYIAPFPVMIVCSHPGMIATRFPEEARLRVIYRDDQEGVIGDEMADEIVATVANRASLVWVDETGFRVAPMRAT